MAKVLRSTLELEAPDTGEMAAIATPLRDYRFAWLLNRHLRLGLRRVADVAPPDEAPGGDGARFARFTGEDPLDKSGFCLISNRFSGAYLLPDLKAFDYFLVVTGGWYADRFPLLLDRIRPLPNVQTVFPLRPPKVKERLNLLLE